MKKILLFVAILSMYSCTKENEYENENDYIFNVNECIIVHEKNQKINKDGRVYKNQDKIYSLYDIVRTETSIMWIRNKYAPSLWMYNLIEEERDTINNVIKLPATLILASGSDGSLDITRHLIDADEIFFTINGKFESNDPNADTCGYIPNSVIINARNKIDSLWSIKDYNGMVDVFHNDFIFYPCTGREYKKIIEKERNKN